MSTKQERLDKLPSKESEVPSAISVETAPSRERASEQESVGPSPFGPVPPVSSGVTGERGATTEATTEGSLLAASSSGSELPSVSAGHANKERELAASQSQRTADGALRVQQLQAARSQLNVLHRLLHTPGMHMLLAHAGDPGLPRAASPMPLGTSEPLDEAARRSAPQASKEPLDIVADIKSAHARLGVVIDDLGKAPPRPSPSPTRG